MEEKKLEKSEKEKKSKKRIYENLAEGMYESEWSYDGEEDFEVKDDISEIIEGRLFLSDLESATKEEYLKKRGIRTVLNCTTTVYRLSEVSGVKYHQFMCFDMNNQNIKMFFEPTFKLIDDAYENNFGCLVHCQAGMSRSGSIVIAFLMKKFKYTYKQAFEYTKKRRSIVQPNEGFEDQLKTFEKEIFGEKVVLEEEQK